MTICGVGLTIGSGSGSSSECPLRPNMFCIGCTRALASEEGCVGAAILTGSAVCAASVAVRPDVDATCSAFERLAEVTARAASHCAVRFAGFAYGSRVRAVCSCGLLACAFSLSAAAARRSCLAWRRLDRGGRLGLVHGIAGRQPEPADWTCDGQRGR